MVGHWHPLIVHLPIGIVLLAAVGEWWPQPKQGNRIRPLLPFLWKMGLLAALVACWSGWWQAQSLEAPHLERHQWSAWILVALTAAAAWLPGKRWWALLNTAVLLCTTYWGGSITHGEHFLSPVLAIENTESAAADLKSDELPPVSPPLPNAAALQRLQNAGWVAAPLARDSAWLTVSAVSGSVPDSSWQILSELSEQISRLYIHDATLPAAAWPVLRQLKYLTRLSLKGCRWDTPPFAEMPQWTYLTVLNLSQSEVRADDLHVLAALPRLKKLYLYQCALTEAERSELAKRLPAVRIDTGGYVVPILPTDTPAQKYPY